MNPSRERLRQTEILDSLAGKRFDFELLSQPELTVVLRKKISSGELTKLGQDFLTDANELFWLRDAPRLCFARSLNVARAEVGRLLRQTSGNIGYITGGLEGLHLQRFLGGITISNFGIETLVVGIEEDSYTRNKGREPLFSTREKVSLWAQLAPEGSVLFVVPQRPGSVSADEYYDWITRHLGLYKNEQVVFLGSKDDPPAIKEAHLRRAFSPQQVLSLSIGKPPWHTSNLITERKN